MNDPRWSPSVTVAAVIERDGRYLLCARTNVQGALLEELLDLAAWPGLLIPAVQRDLGPVIAGFLAALDRVAGDAGIDRRRTTNRFAIYKSG